MNIEQQEKQSNRDEAAIPFPDEVTHLEETQKRLEAAFDKAESAVDRADREYMDVKRYMVQNRGDIDPHEMFQNELALRQLDTVGAFVVANRDKLSKLLESPYFARIDFLAAENVEPSKHYIGRFAFHDENGLLISDWRAPVASMFYDCGIGQAGYMAPDGWISGELTLKRQFKIKQGKMEYALETSDNIQDDVLQRELSNTADEKMKSIIATIQKEQNEIIRNEHADILIIQGVAGSGKTSIALHRIAFLLYRFQDTLSAQNITIISPNQVFGDYISNVLPELGEEPIYEVSFAEIAEIQLEGIIKFERATDALETVDAALANRVQYKSSLDFVSKMDDYIAQLTDIAIDVAAYTYESFSVTAEWVKVRLDAYKKHPLMRRLEMVAEDIYDRFETANIMGHELPKPKTILKNLKAMLKYKNTLALYRDFFKSMGVSNLFVMAHKKTLEWNDVFPFLYLHGAFYGLQESKVIRHLVIDEMQDYTPIQYAVINRLFKCPKTILGDFGQTINPHGIHTLEHLLQLYDGAQFVALHKSYRSTYEIIHFARQIHAVETLEAIERRGPVPRVLRFKTLRDEIAGMKRVMELFYQSEYNTMGIIVKTHQDAKNLYDVLSKNYDISLISPQSKAFESGVSITSIPMCKGLEFDEVMVPDVDNCQYVSEHDRILLYVACTRAMHRLSVLYAGEKSPLLPSD